MELNKDFYYEIFLIRKEERHCFIGYMSSESFQVGKMELPPFCIVFILKKNVYCVRDSSIVCVLRNLYSLQ